MATAAATVVARSATIHAPADRVWAALAAFDEISTWADDVEHSSYLTEATEGIGSARRVQVGRTVLVERITEWSPPRVLAYALEGLPPVVGGATNTWTLVPGGEQTSVTLTSSVEPGSKPAGRIVAPLLARRLAKASDGMLAGLTHHLDEARS